MKIALWSVGKANERYVDEGILIFTKRISHYYPVEWRLFPGAKNMVTAEGKKWEAEKLIAETLSGDVVIALDENGKQMTSVRLADFVADQANKSVKRLVFIIGGAYGLDKSLLSKAGLAWSLSKLVFPHQLVRLILVEQIYRACTIIRNEKYHHS